MLDFININMTSYYLLYSLICVLEHSLFIASMLVSSLSIITSPYVIVTLQYLFYFVFYLPNVLSPIHAAHTHSRTSIRIRTSIHTQTHEVEDTPWPKRNQVSYLLSIFRARYDDNLDVYLKRIRHKR